MINLKVQRAAGVGSVILVGGIALNAVLNYGFGVALAWLVPPEVFGRISVLLSVLLLAATVLAAGFPWTLAREVAKADGVDAAARAEADATFRAALLGNLAIGVALATAFVTVQLTTGGVLPDASTGLTMTVAACIVLISVYSVLWGALHGSRRFDAIGAVQLVETLVKVAGGLALVGLCGYGVPGVALALLASIAVAAWMSARSLGDRLPRRGPIAGARSFAAAAPMAVGTIGFGVLTSLDVLALGVISTAADAGFAAVAVYQAAAVLARAPVLLSAALSEATFPFIAKGSDRAEAHHSFVAGFRWVPLAIVPLQLVLLITPNSALRLFFPESYLEATGLTRAITLGAIGLVVADMLLKALLARGRTGAVALLVPVAVGAQIVVLLVAVPRFGGFGAAMAFAAGSWAAAALLACAYFRHYWPGWVQLRTAARWLGATSVLVVWLAAATLAAARLDLLLIAVGLIVYCALVVRLGLVPAPILDWLRARLPAPAHHLVRSDEGSKHA